jgi:DNA-binding NarL/FixJ family response regulator
MDRAAPGGGTVRDARTASADGASVVASPLAKGRIRIGLVDDHHLIREGLELILGTAPDFEVVGQAATREEALELVARTQPQILLLDLAFPDGDGISLLRDLKGRHPDLRVVVVTMDHGAETVRQALIAGASAYVVKGAHGRELLEAIRAVARGERYLHSSITSSVVEDAIFLSRSGHHLTVREREILSHLAGGRAPTQIAQLLGISVHTVRRHIANLSTKLGLSGRVELARYAVDHGLTRAG